jgi:glycosyltransferase involved in cell wall biosynthesis
VVDGETGYFVKPSAADFVEKIQFLNSHRDVLNEMSSKAHTFSRERFQIEFFIKQYEELIESALNPS